MNLLTLSFAVLLILEPGIVVPDDLENTFQNLKEAEARKDAAQVAKLAVKTCALARQVMSEPAPESADEKDAWSTHVAYAREIEAYTEYALANTALQATPADTVVLLTTLEQQNPKSKYLDEAYGRYFVALNQAGAASKIPAVAEKALTHFPDNEDLLLVLADESMTRQQSDRALTHSERLITVLNRHPKPENISAADWQRKRSAMLGRAHWIAGLVHSEKSQYYEADKDLRAALPLIQGNDAMLAPALYYLGVANYQLGKTIINKAQVLEAAKFSQQAAAIKSPFSQQAWHNAMVMKDEAAKMR
ncbi:MAG TPA: hypothetical protein VFA33_02970 [Bryobacteraceae bacterium]|nr:hypothetical protein [Bryobacteraceae bacterium]